MSPNLVQAFFNNGLSVLAVWQLLSGPSTSHIRKILPGDPLRNVKVIAEHVYSFCVAMFLLNFFDVLLILLKLFSTVDSCLSHYDKMSRGNVHLGT